MKRIFTLLIILLSLSCTRKEHTIGIVFPYSPLTYVPNKKAEIVTISVLMNFYDPLVKFDADFRPTPGLAEYWENTDSITWVFHLRKNAKFKTGKPLSADDVVYTFHTIQNDPESDYRADISDVKNVYSTDSETVVFKLRKPCATFLERLSQILIVQQNCSDSLLKTFSCGTGALIFQKKDREGNIEAIPNEYYFDRKVDFDRVLFIFKSGNLCKITSQKHHTSLLFTFNPNDSCKNLLHLLRIPGPLNSIRYIGINLKKTILRNKDFRKALYYSVCREKIADSISTYYGNTIIPAYEFALPTQIGFMEVKNPGCNHEAEIQNLLKKAGYSGETIPLLVSENRYEYARLIQKDLKKHGIFTTIEAVKAHEIFKRVQENRDFDLFILALIPQSIDIYSVAQTHFHTKTKEKYLGIRNYMGYSNPLLDSIIESTGSLLKKKEREPHLKKIESIITRDLPVIPLFYEGSVYYLSEGLRWKPRIDRIVLANEISLKE